MQKLIFQWEWIKWISDWVEVAGNFLLEVTILMNTSDWDLKRDENEIKDSTEPTT